MAEACGGLWPAVAEEVLLETVSKRGYISTSIDPKLLQLDAFASMTSFVNLMELVERI